MATKRTMPITTKPTTTTKPAAKVAAKVAKPAAIVVTKPAKGAKVATPATPAKVATTNTTKVAKPAATHIRHDDTLGGGSYLARGDGTSATTNIGNGSSSAAVRKRPTNDPTERTDGLLRDLREAFGAKPFMRGNIGAGALGRLWALGHVEHLDGGTKRTGLYGPEVQGEAARFQVTKLGMARKLD